MYPNIEAERARALLTKDALSKKLGISQTTYNKYVKGDSAIPSSVLIQLSQMFSVSTDYLLGLADRGGTA